MHPSRYCTCCLANDGRQVPAVYVATDVDGLQWFECESHEPTDNVLETARIRREPIGDWYVRHGLSAPPPKKDLP